MELINRSVLACKCHNCGFEYELIFNNSNGMTHPEHCAFCGELGSFDMIEIINYFREGDEDLKDVITGGVIKNYTNEEIPYLTIQSEDIGLQYQDEWLLDYLLSDYKGKKVEIAIKEID